MGLFHHYVADHRNPRSLASRMRRRRFALLEAQLARHARPVRVLDVGGTASSWRAMGDDHRGLAVTLLNVQPSTEPMPPGFAAVTGDARDLRRFDDRSFDLTSPRTVCLRAPRCESSSPTPRSSKSASRAS